MTNGIPIKHTNEFVLPGVSAPTFLGLPQGLSFDQWENVGYLLGRMDSARRWWVGDWLNYGEHAFGEKYAQGMDATGLSYESLMNCVWVARKFEISRRRESLSWSHHEAVSRFEPVIADELLDRAEAHGWDRKALREAVNTLKEAAREHAEPKLAHAGSNGHTSMEEVTTPAVVQPAVLSTEEHQCGCHCHTFAACGCDA